MKEIIWDDAEVQHVNTFLKALRATLLKLPDNKQNPITRPTRVAVVGSFLLRTVCPSGMHVDVVLAMPASACSLEQLRRHEYLTLRHDYLSRVAEALSTSSSIPARLVLGALGEKSCVVVKPPAVGGDDADASSPSSYSFEVRLHACPDTTALNLDSLENQKAWLAPNRDDLYYAHVVAEDFRMESILKAQHTFLTQYTACTAALVVMKEWALRHNIPLSSVP
eukprot:PhF_6_TR44248/c0_g1_i1/m.68068